MLTGCITFANGDYTGASRMGVVVAEGLLAAGHRVIAVCGLRPPANQPAVADVLREKGITVFEIGSFNRTLDIRLIHRLRTLLCRESVDYVITLFVTTDTRHAGLAAWGLRIPVISSVQVEILFFGSAPLRKLKAVGFGWIYRNRVARALCTSERIREDLLTNYKMSHSKLEWLPNGVDTSRTINLSPAERIAVRRELQIHGDEFVLLNVGRIDEQKGQLVLLEAIRPLITSGRRFKLLLAGGITLGSPTSMRYRQQLEIYVTKYNLMEHVRFLGWRDDVWKLNAACDCYVHSALWEGFPLAVVEALASGCPVVTTDCAGWPPGFVEGRHGYVVKTGDAESLTVALEKVLRLSQSDRVEIGRNVRELAGERYDIRSIQRRFVEVCEGEVKRFRE